MELEILPELLGLDHLETELFVGFLGFREESKARIAHLVRMELELVDTSLESLVSRGLVLENTSKRVPLYSLANSDSLMEIAASGHVLTEDQRDRLTREGQAIAEVRSMSKMRFINVVGFRERVSGPSPPTELAEFMRGYYPHMDLRLGTCCNFNCLYCLLGHEKKFRRPVEEIEKDLAFGRECGLTKVALTGGEPTIHRQLLSVIKRSRDLGYEKTILVTNASRLSEDRLVDRLIAQGINTFGTSFDVADEEISERLWRRKAYQAVVQGLKNLLAREGLTTISIAVITKQNYRYMPDTARFLAGLPRGPGNVFATNLDFVMPEENAWHHRESVIPKLQDVVPFVREALTVARQLGLRMTYRGIPPCTIGEAFLDVDMDRYMTIFQMHKDQDGTRFNRTSLDLYRTKPSSCRTCRYDRTCHGVYRGYAHLFGTEELRPIAKESLH